MKITVAIPHYKSPNTFRELLRQLVQDDFDQIIVLDDASGLFNKPTKLEKEFPSVTFHYGQENLGAGGNRNRALQLVDEGIIWFLDNDMEVISNDNAMTLRRLFKSNKDQLVGGLMYAKSGTQMQWNYGHEMHPIHDAQFEEIITSLRAGDPSAWQRLQQRGWDYAWLSGKDPTNRSVDWVAEGSFALPVSLFRSVGGYDSAFRYHEGQDLARRIRESGASIKVATEIVTRHLENKSRGTLRRSKEVQDAKKLFFKKHWNMSTELYDRLYE